MRALSILLLFAALSCSSTLWAQVTGRWVTMDDRTGVRRSVVEIVQRNGKLYGTVKQVFRKPGEPQDPICTACAVDDDRHGKRIIGMEVLRDMSPDGDEWSDGTILDPKDGNVYDCRIWLEDGELRMRGYVGFLYRTQTWVRE